MADFCAGLGPLLEKELGVPEMKGKLNLLLVNERTMNAKHVKTHSARADMDFGTLEMWT